MKMTAVETVVADTLIPAARLRQKMWDLLLQELLQWEILGASDLALPAGIPLLCLLRQQHQRGEAALLEHWGGGEEAEGGVAEEEEEVVEGEGGDHLQLGRGWEEAGP